MNGPNRAGARWLALALIAAIALSGCDLIRTKYGISNTPLRPIPDMSQYAGLPASMADDGTFILGNPNAPVLLEQFSSFRCAHCADFSETADRLIDPYIYNGSLAIKFMPIVSHSHLAMLAGTGAICAGQQDPIKFWEMRSVLFSWITETSYTQQHIEAAADRLGLDVAALGDCMGDENTAAILQSVADEADARGVNSTPQIFFNGERPDCNMENNPDCVGNLPYEIVVQNIEQRLAADTRAENVIDAGGE